MSERSAVCLTNQSTPLSPPWRLCRSFYHVISQRSGRSLVRLIQTLKGALFAGIRHRGPLNKPPYLRLSWEWEYHDHDGLSAYYVILQCCGWKCKYNTVTITARVKHFQQQNIFEFLLTSPSDPTYKHGHRSSCPAPLVCWLKPFYPVKTCKSETARI